MADKKQFTGKTPEETGAGPGGKPVALLCEEWEALLVDALDGTLKIRDSAAFEGHKDSCLACAQLLEEAQRGREWLHFLETEPEVPVDLVGRILAKTSGTDDLRMPQQGIGGGTPMLVPAGAGGWPTPGLATGGWAGTWLPMMEKHAAQSRWMMTAAMAFFSIAFTVNMTGLKLTGLKLTELKPTTLALTLTRQFYVADAHVMRYYDNLRFVYELESRVREIRRDAASEPIKSTGKSPAAATPDSKTGDDKKPAAKHTDGSAQKTTPVAAPAVVPERTGEPVMAKFERNQPGHVGLMKLSSPKTKRDAKSVRAERKLV